MQIKKVSISEVEGWDKNPRAIMKDDFVRLKDQIQELGVYKPLIAYYDDSKKKYIVLGGNMRLKAYTDLKMKDVDLLVIQPKNEAEKLKFALSDNDRAGYYEEDKLAELLLQFKDDLDEGRYKIDMDTALTVEKILENFAPNAIDEIALPDEENSGIQQMTFALTDYQADRVREAVTLAKEKTNFDKSDNENSNGNALHAVCEFYIKKNAN